MTWKCSLCSGAKGRTLVVTYSKSRGKGDGVFNVCSHCDHGDAWPNYLKDK